MSIENELQRNSLSAEKKAIKLSEDSNREDTIESPERKVPEMMLDFLINNNLLTKEESALVSADKIDELIIRTAHRYENIPEEIPQENVDKTRRILGLSPNIGEAKIDKSERSGEIKKLTEEMKDYLDKFKNQCPEVLGMILCGSRMDTEKLPAANSDVDTVLILKEGTITDPSTPEGEKLLYKLREFSDNTATESGFPVELDELYSTDDLFAKLQDPNDKSKLTWGWNPNALKYIGEDIQGLDELEMQIKILESINHPDMLEFKKQKLDEAKGLLVKYLGDIKKK